MPTDHAYDAYETAARRILAVLADVERVPEPHLDNPGATHWEHCWHHHAGCLAARIRATLTGEDPDR